MNRKKVAYLIALLLLLFGPMFSCGPGQRPDLPEDTSPPSTEESGLTTPDEPSETTNESNPRFVGPPANQVLDLPKIDFPEVSSPDITPARDLKGTWSGNGVSYWVDGSDGTRIARTTWDVTLVITDQQDNTVGGTLTMNNVNQENLVAQNIPAESYGPDPIENGSVSGSSLYFDVDEWHWVFTFTTDLMSGQYTAQVPGKPCDDKAFTLTRQR